MQILLYEDVQVAALRPLTTARAAMEITIAGFRLLELVSRLGLPVGAKVRPHLNKLFREDHPEISTAAVTLGANQKVLLINGRMTPCKKNLEALRQMVESRRFGVYKTPDGSVAAALISPETAKRLQDAEELGLAIENLSNENIPEIAGEENADQRRLSKQPEFILLRHPHEVVSQHMGLMSESLAMRIETESWQQLQDGVFVKEGVVLGPHTVFDTSKGPVLLDQRVQVGPFCYFRGPIYAGVGARVIEYASLKDAVAIGHTTKIGGEVEGSIVEPYTNKQHHGFLGHSYLGSWINLGAGTCNSDLKNTYGLINMEYDSGRVATNMQFVGCFMGDYTKSAINTGIFTGKVIGVCSMLYGFVTTNVPSFVNYAKLFGQVAELPPEVMIASQARMFARRNVTQRDCDQQLIRDMYRLTSHERDSAMQQLAGF